MKLPKIVILSLIFACIGMTTEVIFTAFYKLASSYLLHTEPDWSLTGKTYVWMLFIYASIPLLFQFFNRFFKEYSLLLKALICVFIIYIIEFTSGAFLELVLGKCPWEYTTGYHIMGYIKLDYFPFWFIFSILIITINEVLNKRLS